MQLVKKVGLAVAQALHDGPLAIVADAREARSHRR
jgi:hypothetical protein